MSADASADERLVPVFIPALVVLLVRAEQLQQSPLTEEQVLAIRNQANCVMVPASGAEAVTESRGYLDVDPEHAWQEWQEVLARQGKKPTAE